MGLASCWRSKSFVCYPLVLDNFLNSTIWLIIHQLFANLYLACHLWAYRSSKLGSLIISLQLSTPFDCEVARTEISLTLTQSNFSFLFLIVKVGVEYEPSFLLHCTQITPYLLLRVIKTARRKNCSWNAVNTLIAHGSKCRNDKA